MKMDTENKLLETAALPHKQEEYHCPRCGNYIGKYGSGSNAVAFCQKCKETSLIDYRDEMFVIKRIVR